MVLATLAPHANFAHYSHSRSRSYIRSNSRSHSNDNDNSELEFHTAEEYAEHLDNLLL